MDDLITYRFNMLKVGAILRQFKRDSGYTADDLEDMTGISADTTKNLLKGRGVLTLERALKYCVVFKVPLESFVALLLEGENINFADQILTYDPTRSTATPITDKAVTPVEDTIPETVLEAALAAQDAPGSAVVDPLHVPVDLEHNRHMEDLHAEIARQDYIIRQLLEILSKR